MRVYAHADLQKFATLDLIILTVSLPPAEKGGREEKKNYSDFLLLA